MAGTQVVRIEKRDTLDTALLLHVTGLVRPVTARSVGDDPIGPRYVLGGDPATAYRRLQKALEARRGKAGGQPAHAGECVIAGPRPYGSEGAMSLELEIQWALDSYRWFVEYVLGPNATVVSAVLHRDETSPHIHILFVPIDSGHSLRWSKVQREAMQRITGRSEWNGRRSGGDPPYRVFQDHYQEQVGSRYELARGRRGSSQRHEDTDRSLAVIQDQLKTKREAEAATKEAAEKEREAEQAARKVAEERKRLEDDHALAGNARELAELWRRAVTANHALSEEKKKEAEEAQKKTDSLKRERAQVQSDIDVGTAKYPRQLAAGRQLRGEAERAKAKVQELGRENSKLRMEVKEAGTARDKAWLQVRKSSAYADEAMGWRRAFRISTDRWAMDHEAVREAADQQLNLAHCHGMERLWNCLMSAALASFEGEQGRRASQFLIFVARKAGKMFEDLWGADWPGKKEGTKEEKGKRGETGASR